MDIDTFLRELSRLEREFGRGQENLASFECKDCEACTNCMFCTHCQYCHACTHCERCVSTTSSSHCVACERCHKCAYCRECQRCLGGSYVIRSIDCVDCTYCYGCVGLIKKEFHILNVRYPRKDYFELSAQLDEDLKRMAGHRPSPEQG